jgi:hypothetical protein
MPDLIDVARAVLAVALIAYPVAAVAMTVLLVLGQWSAHDGPVLHREVLGAPWPRTALWAAIVFTLVVTVPAYWAYIWVVVLPGIGDLITHGAG